MRRAEPSAPPPAPAPDFDLRQLDELVAESEADDTEPVAIGVEFSPPRETLDTIEPELASYEILPGKTAEHADTREKYREHEPPSFSDEAVTSRRSILDEPAKASLASDGGGGTRGRRAQARVELGHR